MESPFEYNEPDLKALVIRFEQMLKVNGSKFFDVEEFEEIIDFYLENQNVSKARKAIEIAITQHPGSSLFLLKQARFFMLSSKLTRALETLDDLISLDPNNYEAFLTRGSVYLKLKKIAKATDEFSRAI